MFKADTKNTSVWPIWRHSRDFTTTVKHTRLYSSVKRLFPSSRGLTVRTLICSRFSGIFNAFLQSLKNVIKTFWGIAVTSSPFMVSVREKNGLRHVYFPLNFTILQHFCRTPRQKPEIEKIWLGRILSHSQLPFNGSLKTIW